MNKIQVTRPTFLINLDNPIEVSYELMDGNWKSITVQTYQRGFPEIKDGEILYIFKENKTSDIIKNDRGFILTKQQNQSPNPTDFMNLGEDAFNKNIHKKLRETLSQTEKQMWINGYLLALTQQKIYSEEEAMEFFIEGYTQRAIAPNARMYAIQLFKELKNK